MLDCFIREYKITDKQADAILNSGLFAAKWYQEKYRCPAYTDHEIFDHFINVGIHLGYDPGPLFNTRYYLATYKDINVPGLSPLLHYILRGRDEDRNPNLKIECSKGTILTKDFLQPLIARNGFLVGDHSYGTPRVIGDYFSELRIGKFCSIGPDVELILANHRKDLVSTYPFNWLSRRWPTAEGLISDHFAPCGMTIGNDVWIGAKAIILPGVKISDGAVIGAASVVRHDVPPYAIVGGNPAKIISYRFDSHVIDELLKISWWDWSDEKIADMLPSMMSEDIASFIATASAR